MKYLKLFKKIYFIIQNVKYLTIQMTIEISLYNQKYEIQPTFINLDPNK